MSDKENGRRGRKKRQSSDPAVSYDEFKEYEGRKYTGMKIGRSHKWYYDQGEWKEKKITPDLWEISYAVTKRRAGRAPEGSGVPVGTEYHWYVLAHQNVTKLDANDYTTSLAGLKFKVAHRRADTQKWSASPKAQRKRMIKFLQSVIEELERQGEEEAAAPRRNREPESVPPKRSKRTTKKGPEAAASTSPRMEPKAPPSMRKPPRRRRKTSR